MLLIIVGSVPLRFSPAIDYYNSQSQIEELALGPGEESVRAAVADPSGGYAYFALYTSPGQIVRVNLTDFSLAGTLTLGSGEDNPATAVIDSEAGFAYFGLDTTPGMVVKLRLADFTRVASLTLEPGEERVSSSVIDSTSGYAYFGAGAVDGRVVKVRLSDFSRVGSVVAAPDRLSSAVVDASSGFAYFGTFTGTYLPFPLKAAAVAKVRLSDLSVVGNITLGVGQQFLSSAVIDTDSGHAYFGTGDPGVIARVQLSDFSRSGVLSPNPGWSSLTSATIDPERGFAYFGHWGVVIKFRLTDFNQVGVFMVGGGDLGAATIDLRRGHVFFATGGHSGFSGKIFRIPLAGEPQVDYSMSAEPLSVNLQPGSSASAVIALAGFNFTNPVGLSVWTTSRYAVLPDISLDGTLAYPGGCGPSSVMLSVSTERTTPPGFYYVTITGVAGDLSRSATVEVSVGLGEPDIVITADPSSFLAEQGSYAYSSVWLYSVGGFRGDIAFTSTISPVLPNGPIAQPLSAGFPILPGTMTNVPFTVATTADTPAGMYNVTLDAISGLEEDRLVLPLTVYERGTDSDAGFRIWAPREIGTLEHYASVTVPFSLTSHGGFIEKVTLAAATLPEGLHFPLPIISPARFPLNQGESNVVLMKLRADEATLSGNYTLTITGTSSKGSESLSIRVVVVDSLAPFDLDATNAELSFEVGSSGMSNVVVSSLTPRACTVQLSADNSSLPEGTEVTFGSSLVSVGSRGEARVPISISSSREGNFGLRITGTGGPFSRSILLNVSVVGTSPPLVGGIPSLSEIPPTLLGATALLVAVVFVSTYLYRRRQLRPP